MPKHLHKLLFYTSILIASYSLCLLLFFFPHQTKILLRIQATSLFSLSSYLVLILHNKHLPTIKQQKNIHIFHIILFIVYVSQLCHLLFFASEFSRDQVNLQDSYFYALSQQWQYNTNLQPFYTIRSMISIIPYSDYYQEIAFLNIFGNIIAFAPFSYFLPNLFPIMRKTKYFIWTMTLIICSVEILQFLTLTGSMDVDDFILNMLGSLITYTIYMHITKKNNRLKKALL